MPDPGQGAQCSELRALSSSSVQNFPACAGSPLDRHTCYVTEVRQPRASTALTAFSF